LLTTQQLPVRESDPENRILIDQTSKIIRVFEPFIRQRPAVIRQTSGKDRQPSGKRPVSIRQTSGRHLVSIRQASGEDQQSGSMG
jgi:hypothetical protein